jgi:hypothetical protein
MRTLILLLGTLAVASFIHFGSAAAKEATMYPWYSVNGGNADSKVTDLRQGVHEKRRAQADPADAGTHRTHRGRRLRPRDESEMTSCVYANFWLVCAEN